MTTMAAEAAVTHPMTSYKEMTRTCSLSPLSFRIEIYAPPFWMGRRERDIDEFDVSELSRSRNYLRYRRKIEVIIMENKNDIDIVDSKHPCHRAG